MRTLSHEAAIYASRPWIWKMLIDVSRWREWDHDVKESHLFSSFDSGVKGYLVDNNNNRSLFQVTEIQPYYYYSNKYNFPLGTKLHFTHMIIGNSEPYCVKFQARFRGLLAVYYYLKLGKEIQSTMQRALFNLSNVAQHDIHENVNAQ